MGAALTVELQQSPQWNSRVFPCTTLCSVKENQPPCLCWRPERSVTNHHVGYGSCLSTFVLFSRAQWKEISEPTNVLLWPLALFSWAQTAVLLWSGSKLAWHCGIDMQMSKTHGISSSPYERLIFFFFLVVCFFNRLYLLFDAFIVSQNNLDLFLLQLLRFFFPSRLRALVCVCLYIHIDVCKFSLL